MSNDNNVKVQVLDSADVKAAGTVAAPREITVTDARGRVMGIRKPPFLAQFDLIEALGAAAENKTFMGMASLVMWVKSIDGESVSLPTSKLQIRALLQRLDEDGYTAVAEGIEAHFAGDINEAEAQTSVKNA
ncbi:hypothetical protein EO087_00245 [Dyella sp. M7H15-1]|uniref:hypothetical protein n=1 Tax=Dyella sp. M7H15-1 TaxID=2501295 RepID=UPI001004EAE2|nr:hypothetical protein [Dyella sp. M7H15-1]QAU22595.1 hypothetical protein EO087_00245 [Dyella sp. M7H15-1]